MKAATRAPSWANTQPWEIFVAAGEALERLRTEYTLRSQKRVPSQSGSAGNRRRGHLFIQQRMAELMSERARLIRTNEKRDEATVSNKAYSKFQLSVFWCADCGVSLLWIAPFRPGHYLTMGLLAQSVMLAAQAYQVDSAPAFPFRIVP